MDEDTSSNEPQDAQSRNAQQKLEPKKETRIEPSAEFVKENQGQQSRLTPQQANDQPKPVEKSPQVSEQPADELKKTTQKDETSKETDQPSSAATELPHPTTTAYHLPNQSSPRKKKLIIKIVILAVGIAAIGGLLFLFVFSKSDNTAPEQTAADDQSTVTRSLTTEIDQQVLSERAESEAILDGMVEKINSEISSRLIYDGDNQSTCTDDIDVDQVFALLGQAFLETGIDPNIEPATPEDSKRQEETLRKALEGKEIEAITTCVVERQLFIQSTTDTWEDDVRTYLGPLGQLGYEFITELPEYTQIATTPVKLDESKNAVVSVLTYGKNHSQPGLPRELDINALLANPNDVLIRVDLLHIHESLVTQIPVDFNESEDFTVLDPSLYASTTEPGYSEQRDSAFNSIDWQPLKPTSLAIDDLDLNVTPYGTVLEYKQDSLSSGNSTTVSQFKFSDFIKRFVDPPNNCNIREGLNAARFGGNTAVAPKPCVKLATSSKSFEIYGTADLEQNYQTGYLVARVDDTLITYDFNSFGKKDVNQQNIDHFSSLLDELEPVDKNLLYESIAE